MPELVADPAGGSVEIDAFGFSEIAAAPGVLARDMRDNADHVAIFGPDPDKRVRARERGVRRMLFGVPAPCARTREVPHAYEHHKA